MLVVLNSKFYPDLKIRVPLILLSVSKITYLPLSTGLNNKGNPLIGVEHSFFIFIIPKGAKEVCYF